MISGNPIPAAIFSRLLGIRYGLFGARHHGDAGLLRQAARGSFIAQQVEQFGAGSDEGDAGAFAGTGQSGILGEESVAGMDGVDALLTGEIDDAVHVEVGLHRPFAFADEVGFVGFETVQREAVFLRINGDRAQAKFVGGAKNADSDFATVQSKQFFHGKGVLL